MARKSGGIVVLILLLGLSIFLLNCGSSNSRPAGVLFVTSAGANIVESYAINLGNGDLSQLNTSAATGGAPAKIVLDPTRTAVYVLNTGSASISTYKVNTNGSLSKADDVLVPGSGAVSMARDSVGKFLFVVTAGVQSGDIVPPQLFVFSAQPGSTTLSAVGSPLTLTRVPTAISAVTFTVPNGSPQTFLYVTSDLDLIVHNDNTVSEYSVDSSGNVTEEAGSPYTTGTVPSAVLPVFTEGNNLFVYVADNKPDNNIVTFVVCTVVSSSCTQTDVDNARMTPIQSPVSVGISPLDMITDATRSFLYVANSGSNSVSSFRISPTTGKLTSLNPATVSTGAAPVALALHPNGEFLYVANSGSGSGEGSVSGFNVNINSGALSGGIQISSSAQPAGLMAK